MKYSKKLIDEVKVLYPDYPEIHKLADNGDEFLGRYIDDSLNGWIHYKDVLTLSHKELLNMAGLCKRKVALYKKWNEEYQKHKTKL